MANEQKIVELLDQLCALDTDQFFEGGEPIDWHVVYNMLSVNGEEVGLGYLATIDPIRGIIATLDKIMNTGHY